MASIINLTLRGLQFLFSLLILALVGNMIADSTAGNSMVNYDMFVAVFSMLSLIYLIASTVKEAFIIHPMIALAVDVLNALFFFIGGVATAARLGVHSCGNEDYTRNNSVIRPTNSLGKRCHEAQAVTAFLWFGFAAYLASAIFSGLASRGTGGIGRGGIRRGGPSMSQA